MEIKTRYAINQKVVYWKGDKMVKVRVIAIYYDCDGIYYRIKNDSPFGDIWKNYIAEKNLYPAKENIIETQIQKVETD